MKAYPERAVAMELLKKYNSEPFHIQHAWTVEGTMRWYAEELGYGEDADFWATVGLLHDVDFGSWPEQHCLKAPELLAEIGCSEEFIHAVCSHGYGICCDVEPVHEMEKVPFAADELLASEKPITLPPSSYIAASKLSLVLVLGSKKSVASFLPRQDSEYFFGLSIMSNAVDIKLSISKVDKSKISHKLRIVVLLI